MWPFYYFNFEKNHDVLKSKCLSILLNKNINFNKNETESKMENPTHSFRETRLSSYKNRTLKLKLWWVGACKRRKRAFFCPVYFFQSNGFLLTFVFPSMYSIRNTLSEYTYCYISKNVTSYTFLLYEKNNKNLKHFVK